MAWPLVAGLALAAGGAAANYFGNKAQAENLEDGTYRLSFQTDFGQGRLKERIQEFVSGLLSHSFILGVKNPDEAVGVK
jgi:hypothetical protein